MVRYFVIAVLLFVLYWVAKGTLRRFLAPPREARKRPPVEGKEKVVEPGRPAKGIDYSKVKDANYRDLDR